MVILDTIKTILSTITLAIILTILDTIQATIIQTNIMIILQQLTDMSAVQDWTEITR